MCVKRSFKTTDFSTYVSIEASASKEQLISQLLARFVQHVVVIADSKWYVHTKKTNGDKKSRKSTKSSCRRFFLHAFFIRKTANEFRMSKFSLLILKLCHTVLLL